LTFDSNGVITGASNNALSVANTLITGNIISSQIASVNGSVITANTIANSAIQTGAVENYMLSQGTSFGIRNKIINGAMMISQRNGTSTITPADNDYVTDRWSFGIAQSSKLTSAQSSVAPAGFSNSVLVTSSSAFTPSSTDLFRFTQKIEGFNTVDLAFGTASAKSVTLTFWVQSSLTGTFGGSLQNNAGDRSYPFTYTISSANTWEQKSLTILGDTTGTWVGATNGIGLYLNFSLGAGSSRIGTAGAWAAAGYYGATGQVNLVSTNAATWYITGVQFEKGSQATPFEYRPYGKELMLCQRYYCKSYQQSVAPATSTTLGVTGVIASTASLLVGGFNTWPVTMRTTPTVTIYSQIGTSGKLSAPGAVDTGTTVISETPSEKGAVGINSAGGFTIGSWYYGHFVATAEL
jgi:hypothetical protein